MTYETSADSLKRNVTKMIAEKNWWINKFGFLSKIFDQRDRKLIQILREPKSFIKFFF